MNDPLAEVWETTAKAKSASRPDSRALSRRRPWARWTVATFVGIALLVGGIDGCKAAFDKDECARNGFGAKFCGQELKEYRQHLREAQSAP